MSTLYDYLLFPLLCVWYNQTSRYSKLPGIIRQACLYSIVVTIVEHWLERNTKVIQYKQWTPYHTFTSLLLTFLGARGAIGSIRKYSD